MPNCISCSKNLRRLGSLCSAFFFFVQYSVVKENFCDQKQTTFSSAVVVRISGVVESVAQWCSTWLGLMMVQMATVETWCQPPTNTPFNHATSTISSSLLLMLMKNRDWGHRRERTTAFWCRSGNTKRPSQTVTLYRSPSLPNSGIGCSDQTSGRGPWPRERKFGYVLAQTERGQVWELSQMSWRTLCDGNDDVVHSPSDSRDYMPLSKINLEILERFLYVKISWRVSAVVVGDRSKNSVKIYTGGGRTNLHKWRKFFFFGW